MMFWDYWEYSDVILGLVQAPDTIFTKSWSPKVGFLKNPIFNFKSL